MAAKDDKVKEATAKDVAEAKQATPAQDGVNVDLVNNEIGPSGDQQAPAPATNAAVAAAAGNSPKEALKDADDGDLSDAEKDHLKEVADHPLTKQAEDAQKAAEKEQEAFKKEQEDN